MGYSTSRWTLKMYLKLWLLRQISMNLPEINNANKLVPIFSTISSRVILKVGLLVMVCIEHTPELKIMFCVNS